MSEPIFHGGLAGFFCGNSNEDEVDFQTNEDRYPNNICIEV
jgi:hypothetical protein